MEAENNSMILLPPLNFELSDFILFPYIVIPNIFTGEKQESLISNSHRRVDYKLYETACIHLAV